MSPNNISGMFHDASPTWNGFNYQGKVALYTALTYINNKNIDTSKYELELEWFEDFSIKDNTNYISIHQVKAYSQDSLSEYSEALFKLFEKIACGLAPKAYLHTWKNINLQGDTWHTRIKSIIIQIIENGDSILSELSNILSHDNQVAETIGKIKNPRRGRPSDIIKIIKESVQNYFESNTDKTINDINISIMRTIIENAINMYPSRLESYKAMIEADDTILGKIERFSYSGNSFCELDSISTLIKEQIIKYYTITGQTAKANDSTHIVRAYLHLFGEMDSHITNRHLEYQNRVKACISFSRLIEILESPLSNNSETYYLYHLRNELNRLREIYCVDCINLNLNDCESCNLAYAIPEINDLNDESFKMLCKNISPEVNCNEINLQSFRDYLPVKGLNNSVFESLLSIKKEYSMDRNKIEYKLNDNIIALVTTIFYPGSPRQREGDKKRIVDTILKNIEIEESLREVDIMISDDVDIPSLYEETSDFINLTQERMEEFNEDLRDSENFCKTKRVSVKPLHDVVRELI
jgi:hypothetical protein